MAPQLYAPTKRIKLPIDDGFVLEVRVPDDKPKKFPDGKVPIEHYGFCVTTGMRVVGNVHSTGEGVFAVNSYSGQAQLPESTINELRKLMRALACDPGLILITTQQS